MGSARSSARHTYCTSRDCCLEGASGDKPVVDAPPPPMFDRQPSVPIDPMLNRPTPVDRLSSRRIGSPLVLVSGTVVGNDGTERLPVWPTHVDGR